MRRLSHIAITRTTSGAWTVAALIDGYRVTRTYYGYTRRESLARFRTELPSA